MPVNTFIGTAGWSLSSQLASEFKDTGTHLQRYATRFNATEINTSFKRSHRRQTYERWAASVPEDFRFAVKLPKAITHEQQLVGFEEDLARFRSEAEGLGHKLGVILVQLPPSLAFDARAMKPFFAALAHWAQPQFACEPRHASWFSNRADAFLAKHRVARVASDPARVPQAATPGGSDHFVYFRLHGSPRIYYSSYDATALEALRSQLKAYREAGKPTWCIFDNTASSAALENALALSALNLG